MVYCSNCGSAVEGRFCPKCGTAVSAAAGPDPAGVPPVTNAAPVAAGGLTDNVAAALCYLLGLLTGILFLVLAPYNQNRTIRFHAFQAIFFHVGVIILSIVFMIISAILGHIPIVGWVVGLFGWMAIWLGALILWLLLMYKAYNNERLVLPVVGPLAEKQA
jgi:uncharacterized membrane protein